MALHKRHYFWTRIVGTDGTGSNVHIFNVLFINSLEHCYPNNPKLETLQLQAKFP